MEARTISGSAALLSASLRPEFDHRQQVPEIMGDPACHLAECRKSLYRHVPLLGLDFAGRFNSFKPVELSRKTFEGSIDICHDPPLKTSTGFQRPLLYIR